MFTSEPGISVKPSDKYHFRICNSIRFVSYKDIKMLMADLKKVYAAPTEEAVLSVLEAFGNK